MKFKLRSFRWSLTDFVLTLTLIFLGIGLVHEIEVQANAIVCRVVGPWELTIWNKVTNAGWGDSAFAIKYLVFIINKLPGWLTLAGLCFFSGRARNVPIHRIGPVVAGSIPITAMIIDALISWKFLFYPNLRLVSLCGAALCFGGWYIGVRTRRNSLHTEGSDLSGFSAAKAIRLIALIIYATLGIMGWCTLSEVARLTDQL